MKVCLFKVELPLFKVEVSSFRVEALTYKAKSYVSFPKDPDKVLQNQPFRRSILLFADAFSTGGGPVLLITGKRLM
ncbi:MAG TPA: hypothetical protein VIH57_18490 [Bacteroidales bacterium]